AAAASRRARSCHTAASWRASARASGSAEAARASSASVTPPGSPVEALLEQLAERLADLAALVAHRALDLGAGHRARGARDQRVGAAPAELLGGEAAVAAQVAQLDRAERELLRLAPERG